MLSSHLKSEYLLSTDEHSVTVTLGSAHVSEQCDVSSASYGPLVPSDTVTTCAGKVSITTPSVKKWSLPPAWLEASIFANTLLPSTLAALACNAESVPLLFFQAASSATVASTGICISLGENSEFGVALSTAGVPPAPGVHSQLSILSTMDSLSTT